MTMGTNSEKTKAYKILVAARSEEEALDLAGQHIFMTVGEADEYGN